MKDIYVSIGAMTPRALVDHLRDNHPEAPTPEDPDLWSNSWNPYEVHAKLDHGGARHIHRGVASP